MKTRENNKKNKPNTHPIFKESSGRWNLEKGKAKTYKNWSENQNQKEGNKVKQNVKVK